VNITSLMLICVYFSGPYNVVWLITGVSSLRLLEGEITLANRTRLLIFIEEELHLITRLCTG
jgi:hypothetical protein